MQFKETVRHLRRLKDFPEKATAIKEVMLDFISSSFKQGQTLEEVTSRVQKFYAEELLISKELCTLAQQVAKEEHTKYLSSHAALGSQSTNQPVAEPLYSKDTLYHATICSHAVYASDAGNYQQFFKNKDFVPGHNFKAISMSRSKQDCFLVAQTDESTYYFAFKGQPLLTEWAKDYNYFGEGTCMTLFV